MSIMNQPEPADHYLLETYDTKGRFISYWHQINEILALKPGNVLEVGLGNGFIAEYLKKRGVNVTTLDIVGELKPDVVGSVLSMPFAEGMFDIVVCYEVLEHLPYGDFAGALAEIRRVSRRHVVLSLPDNTAVYRLDVELPWFGEIKKLISRPFPRLVRHDFDGVHYWVIGKAQYPLGRIESNIRNAGFKIKKTYRVFEFYGHRFFLLEKS